MKGASTVIVLVLILLMAVSLTFLGYVFLSGSLGNMLNQTESSLGRQSSSRLAEISIESIEANNVSVKNTGKVKVTNFNVFVNDRITDFTPSSDVISPGESAEIKIKSPILKLGDIVKVTTGEGASAIDSVTYVAQLSGLFVNISYPQSVQLNVPFLVSLNYSNNYPIPGGVHLHWDWKKLIQVVEPTRFLLVDDFEDQDYNGWINDCGGITTGSSVVFDSEKNSYVFRIASQPNPDPRACFIKNNVDITGYDTISFNFKGWTNISIICLYNGTACIETGGNVMPSDPYYVKNWTKFYRNINYRGNVNIYLYCIGGNQQDFYDDIKLEKFPNTSNKFIYQLVFDANRINILRAVTQNGGLWATPPSSTYPYIWTRDANFIFDGLLAIGEYQKAKNYLNFINTYQLTTTANVPPSLLASGSPPITVGYWANNYYPDGTVANQGICGLSPPQSAYDEIDKEAYPSVNLYDYYKISGNINDILTYYPKFSSALLYALFGRNKEGLPNYNSTFKLMLSEIDENEPSCGFYNRFNFGYQILYIRTLRDAAKMADILYNNGYSTISVYGSNVKTDALRDTFKQYASEIENGASTKFYNSSLNIYVAYLYSDGSQNNYNEYSAPVMGYLGWFADTFNSSSPFNFSNPIIVNTWQYNSVKSMSPSGLFGFPGMGGYENAFHWTMLMMMWGYREGAWIFGYGNYLDTVTSYLSPAINYEIPENEVLYSPVMGRQQSNTPLFWSEGAYLKLLRTVYPIDQYLFEECYNLDSGENCTVTLKSLATGNINLFYRAWSDSKSCGEPHGFERDPSSGTCSPNCDAFPEDVMVCDTYSKTLSSS